MAEAFLKAENLGIEVFSRGVNAQEDKTASDNAILAMAEKGINITNHRSHKIIPEDIEKADLVLTMTKSQKEYLQKISGNSKKIRTNYEFAQNSNAEVNDPHGKTIDEYRKCAAELEKLVKEIAMNIKKLEKTE